MSDRKRSRNFMAQVNVIQAIEALTKANEELGCDLELQAVHHLRCAIHKLADAMEGIYKESLR